MSANLFWHPPIPPATSHIGWQIKDPQSKLKYAQISEAYKKLSTIMEGKDSYRGDSSHEIAAFMRMFMDMVGITENDTLPAGRAKRERFSALSCVSKPEPVSVLASINLRYNLR